MFTKRLLAVMAVFVNLCLLFSGYLRNKFSLFSFRALRTKLISLSLIISMTGTTTFAAADGKGLVISAGEFGRDFQHYLKSSSLASIFSTDTVSSLLRKISGKPKQSPIQRIVILPVKENNTLTVMQGETVNFTAIGLRNEQPVGGVLFKWTYTNVTRQTQAKPFINGTFNARTPGKFIISAFAQGVQANITVNVNPSESYGIQKIIQKDESQRTVKEKQALAEFTKKATIFTRQISSKKVYNLAEEKRLGEVEKQKLEQVRVKQKENLKKRPNPIQNTPPATDNPRPNGGPSAEGVESSEAPPAESSTNKTTDNARTEFIPEPIPYRPPDDDGWDSGNWPTADNPSNWVGSPAGSSPDAGAANGNFQFSAPVLSLPGRGLDVNLSLNYNSRLWSKAGTEMIYDADKGNPAPGWNIGFGKMIRMGGTGGCMLVTPDGSRHSYDGTNSTYSYGSTYYDSYTGHTTDGSFIDYSCSYYSDTYGTSLWGYARLANGTKITYSSPTSSYDQLFPTEIQDAQGNYITITYVGNQGPNIQTITDTLGRTITFNYDTSDRLINITGPGYNGATRTFVRLHYAQPTLSYAFDSSLTTDTATNTPYLIDAIYYPDTNMGYWFAESNSYSSYGMIARIMSFRGMTFTPGSSGTQGTMNIPTGSSGAVLTRDEVYNFPLTAVSTLTDAPLYTSYSDSWDRDNGVGTAATNYSVSTTSTDQTITITRPDGVLNKQISIINPGNDDDGMFVENQVLDGSSNVLSKTKTFLGSGDYGTSRPTKIEVSDQLTNKTTTEFTYGTGVYNQVTEAAEKDFGGNLYRKTVYTYENSSNYTASYTHILSLVKSMEVWDNASHRLTKTTYQYDNNGTLSLANTPSVVMHKFTYDPYTSETQQTDNCAFGQYNNDACTYEGEIVYNPYETMCSYTCYEYEVISAFDTHTKYRGNLTKVTTYADAATPSQAIDHDYTYDETGNQITAITDCCQQMSFTYSIGTQFSQPDSRTKGSSTVNITDGATYDDNTGVVKVATDFNGRTTTMSYDLVARPTQITKQNGAYTTITYDDYNLSKTVASFNYGVSAPVSSSSSLYNGHGQTVSSSYATGSGTWNATDVRYDIIGRTKKVSVPYNNVAGAPSLWNEYFYDELSRIIETRTPDTSTTYNSTTNVYNGTRPTAASATPGQSVLSTDAWGRQRWARTDDFGRVVEVMEPNPTSTNGHFTGSGDLLTTYDYDPLDQLIQTNQINPVDSVNQKRKFAYDSLGRLILQKLAEQTATIDNTGTFIGDVTGAVWSSAFVYDGRSNLIQKTDARGVKTNFDYLDHVIGGGALDPLNRLQGVSYDVSGADTTFGLIDNDAYVTIGYETTYDLTRVNSVTTHNVATETNVYHATEKDRITDYNLTFADHPTGYTMQTSYDYDLIGRLTQVVYPTPYNMSGGTRKQVNPFYDDASRLAKINVNTSTQLDDINYNPRGQATHLRTGYGTANPVVEDYTYDAFTGLLTHQTSTRTSTSAVLMNLSYGYGLGGSKGSGTSRTGNLTHIEDNLHQDRNRDYEYDALGRLTKAKGGLAAGAPSGSTSDWSMTYDYDRYGNKTGVMPNSGGIVYNAATSSTVPIPADGINGLTYDSLSNRITNSGWVYDLAGNLIEGQNDTGSWQKFEYDAAGRLIKIKNGSGTLLETYKYGADRQRLIKDIPNTQRTYYCWGGSNPLIEYTENLATPSNPVYSKSYVYAGSRLLSTAANNSGTETIEFQHPDRLGTKLITNPSTATQVEQAALPFGTEIAAETTGSINQRFTSYDRSSATGLDYAVNRIYSSGQGRFTQVDPAQDGMNLYAYVGNDPINSADPTGLNADSCSSEFNYDECGGSDSFWNMMGSGGSRGGSRFGDTTGYNNTHYGGGPAALQQQHEERINNDIWGNGFLTNAESNRAIDGGILATVFMRLSATIDGSEWVFDWADVIWKGGEQNEWYARNQEDRRLRRGRYSDGPIEMLDVLDHAAIIGVGEGIVKGAATTIMKAGAKKAAFSELPELGNKLRYVFGEATGNLHNIQRSTDMVQQLGRIGIFDNAAGNAYLRGQLGEIYNSSSGILQSNGRVLRESLLVGPNGVLKMSSVWEGNKLITVSLYGKPVSW